VDDAIFPTFIELKRTLKSVRDERLMVGVAARHVAVAAHLAAVTTMLAAMLARMSAAMTTTVRGGHGVSGGSSGAAVRVLSEGEGAEAQHKNEGQDNSDFISHCSILLVIMIKVLLRLERDVESFPRDPDLKSSRSCLSSEQRSCHSRPRAKNRNLLYLPRNSFHICCQRLWR
jgi:hypothetical protein